MKNARYEAQALAIAMVVLIISSILGLSIFSRVSSDKSLAIKEQASAEALEVADLLLEYITQADIQDILAKAPAGVSGDGTELNQSDNEISAFFTALGIEGFDSEDLGFCSITSGDDNNGNEYTLTLKEASENSFFEIRPGSVRSFVLTDLSVAPDCSTNITFDTRGESQSGFSIEKIYTNDSGETKPYDYDDVENYCFSDDGITCNSLNFTGGGWIPYNMTSSVSLPLSDTSFAGYELSEVRIKAIGGTIGMSYSLTPTCPSQGLRLISIQAEATCNGVYRAKELLIPENQWSLPIFDYVIFNGEGAI
jgi:type II secretory pathway pseudopilin PulG